MVNLKGQILDLLKEVDYVSVTWLFFLLSLQIRALGKFSGRLCNLYYSL